MKKFRLLLLVLALSIGFVPVQKLSVYAATKNVSPDSSTDGSSDTSTDTSTTEEDSNNTSTDTTDTTTVDVNSSVGLCDNWATPVATYGQSVDIVLPLVNLDKYKITNVIVTPELSTDTNAWPFEIEKSSYTTELTELLGSNDIADKLERRQEITYTFKTRKDVTTGYQKITFALEYTDINGTKQTGTIDLFIKTVGAPGSGNGSDDSTATPRLIVSGFTTDPAEVNAGNNFNLNLHIKNTSSITAISNLQLDLQAVAEGSDEQTSSAAFLPVQGSSTLFVNRIKPGETKDVSIAMNAKADLSQKPYVLDIKMAYQDSNNKEYSSDASVSIPVKQQSRFEVSNMEVMPQSIPIDSQSNVTFSIYNTGKTKLYNVSVKFEGASVTGGDTYIGNIESGATGNVDTMLTGATATTDDGSIKVIISYEDEAGKVSTSEQKINLTVTDEAMNNEAGGDFTDGPMIEKKSAFPLFIILIILFVVIAAIVAAIILLLARKKKKALLEEESFVDNFDFNDTEGKNDSLSDNWASEKDGNTVSEKEGGDHENS